MISALFLGTSCTEDMEYKDVDITPVSQLYSPKDNQSVQLLASATASLFFEWSSSLAADGNAPQYEVVFDKVDGDFSNPIYRQTSDDLGTRNYATISHKVLDKVAQMAGVANGETGTVKWTVVSSRGIVSKTSSLSRTLTSHVCSASLRYRHRCSSPVKVPRVVQMLLLPSLCLLLQAASTKSSPSLRLVRLTSSSTTRLVRSAHSTSTALL